MAELNLQQIADRLNAEFTGEARKLVFWYDDKGAFAEDIGSLTLQNAKIYRLEPDNQFYTKYFLEKVDPTTNYLIYAPFPKPDVKDNHLEDTFLYSKQFNVDRISQMTVDLGISPRGAEALKKYETYFANKDRVQRFYDLEIETYSEENICIGIMAAICRARTCSFEEVVRILLTEGEDESEKHLVELQKYGLLAAFWEFVGKQFGYHDEKPTLEKLVIAMFVTYTAKSVQAPLPKAWSPFVSDKAGNIIAFLDNLMNSVLYRDRFDALSAAVAAKLGVSAAFEALPPESLLGCETVLDADRILIRWLRVRLLEEDVHAALQGKSISAICELREKLHFGAQTGGTYRMLRSACALISSARYRCPVQLKKIAEQYIASDYRLDAEYRRFYEAYDGLEEPSEFETLRDLVEKIYTNEYLSVLLPQWNAALKEEDALFGIPQQRDFYEKNLKMAKERTVVIISDAMRFEVGQELFQKLSDDPKSKVSLRAQLGVLPSYTRLGMAALLPHEALCVTDDFRVLVDGMSCDTLAARQEILQKYCPDSRCVQFDDIKSLKKAELREIFTGKQIVYVYHNQIDARGDKPNTEDEVFSACEEAVGEIAELIRRISLNANTHRFLITADHGFLYKRDKLSESDKIGGVDEKNAFLNRRFILSPKPVSGEGIASFSIAKFLRGRDSKYVSVPVGSNVFKVAGGGQNYVHGGSSPQEMIVPLIDVKMERGHMETKNASIALVSMLQKITNKIVTLDFIQSDAVSDIVKAMTYRLFFLSEDGEKISNENMYASDSREPDAQKRIFRLRFRFKDQKYDRSKRYFLVICDEATGLEVSRYAVIMDLAFSDDYGF